MKIIKATLVVTLAFLTSCSNIDILPSPNSPSIIHIGITPTLAPLFQNKLNDCATQTPGMGIVIETLPQGNLNLADTDIIIQIEGLSQNNQEQEYQIGVEEILLISSPDLKITEIMGSNIGEVFSSLQTPYKIYTYPENHELQNLFFQIFQIEKISPHAIIVPNPSAMLAAVNNNLNAVGYVPKSWYDGELPSVNLSDIVDNDINFPIVVITNKTPQGRIRSFIGCLQRETNIQ